VPDVSPSLLDVGPLVPVARAAELVLGESVSARTILRWAIAGRRGVPLPTRRGRRRKHITTVDAFKAWIAATSDSPRTAPVSNATAATLARLGLSA
jgi:hypothetical protein